LCYYTCSRLCNGKKKHIVATSNGNHDFQRMHICLLPFCWPGYKDQGYSSHVKIHFVKACIFYGKPNNAERLLPLRINHWGIISLGFFCIFKNPYITPIGLVGGLEHEFMTFHILGMILSQLTNSYCIFQKSRYTTNQIYNTHWRKIGSVSLPICEPWCWNMHTNICPNKIAQFCR